MAIGPSQQLGSSDRIEMFILGVVIALCVGVPLTFFSIYFFADNVTTLAIGFIFFISGVATTGTLLILFRKRLLRRLSGATTRALHAVAEPGLATIQAAARREPESALEHGQEAARRLSAWIAWLMIRRWIVGLLIGLVATFAGFIGSALLFQQNKLITVQNGLIEKQNAYWQTQNQSIQEQLEEEKASRLLIHKAELTRLLYDTQPCPANPRKMCSVSSLRTRQNAVRAYANLERSRGETIDLSNLVLHEEDQAVSLREIDLTGASLRHAHLNGADLNRARLDKADLFNAVLNEGDLSDASLRNASLEETKLFDVNLKGADLTGAHFLRTDLREAVLTGAKLDGATFSAPQADNKTVWPEGFDPAQHNIIMSRY